MVTVERIGKSTGAALMSTISKLGKEDYDSAYALWKMGAPVRPLADQYNVNTWALEYSFELRQIHESKE